MPIHYGRDEVAAITADERPSFNPPSWWRGGGEASTGNDTSNGDGGSVGGSGAGGDKERAGGTAGAGSSTYTSSQQKLQLLQETRKQWEMLALHAKPVNSSTGAQV